MCRRCRLGCSQSVSRAEKHTLRSRFWHKSQGIPRRKQGLEGSPELKIFANWAFSPKALLRPWAIPWIEALLVGYLGFCVQFFLSTCIFFGKPVAHARHSPPPRRVIHAIVNGKDQLVATRAARGPQAKLRSARFARLESCAAAGRLAWLDSCVAIAPAPTRAARCASKATSAVRRREGTRATSTLAASTSRKKGTPCTNSA